MTLNTPGRTVVMRDGWAPGRVVGRVRVTEPVEREKEREGDAEEEDEEDCAATREQRKRRG